MAITLQDIFNAAWQHFIIEDNPPARDPKSHVCQYLTTDGRKCAVGLCIPDGHPAQGCMGTFGHLAETYPELFSIPDSIGEDCLNRFQSSLHDGMASLGGTWDFPQEVRKRRYEDTARAYDLSIPSQTGAEA